MPSLTTLRALIEEEMVQLEEEGCDVHVTASDIEAASGNLDSLLKVYGQLRTLKPRADFPYREPSDLASIRKERPEGARQLNARTCAK